MIEFEVDGWNNFCRVFELPEQFSTDYCFGGGIDTNFKMVDWFNPFSGLPIAAVSKEVWRNKVGKIETKLVTADDFKVKLEAFLLNKKYVKQGRKYIVIANFGACFMFEKEKEQTLEDEDEQ